MKKFLGLLVSIGFSAVLTLDASASDVRQGETLAKRWCAACHVVSADQDRGSAMAPAFSEIAGKPDMTAGRLALFLLSPHPRMPDMNLTRAEAANLAAYIASQGK